MDSRKVQTTVITEEIEKDYVSDFNVENLIEEKDVNEYILKNMKEVLSYDLVEFNPLRDIERKTEQIALNLLAQVIRAADNKKKWEQKLYY